MKMKMNTVKSKLVVGVATVTLLTGAGFVAANTDAGAGLQNWYDKSFGANSVDVVQKAASYGQTKTNEFSTEFNGMKADATDSINSTKDQEEDGAKGEIDSAKQSHIDAINNKEAAIADYMDNQFDAISLAGKNVINQTGNRIVKDAKADLEQLTVGDGAAAIAALETELNAEKTNAVTALEQEIATTKQALLKQLSDENTATTAELKAAIDAKIVEIRGTITAKKDELVAIQQTLIASKADELELAAKAELDAVVSSINN